MRTFVSLVTMMATMKLTTKAVSTVLVFAGLAIAAGCTADRPVNEIAQGGHQLRDLSQAEALSDFEELVTAFRTLYGPLQYKERRFRFKFEDLAAEYREKVKAARTDLQIQAIFSEFAARFQDGHVGLRHKGNSAGLDAYVIPVFIVPVENKALVAKVGDGLKTSRIEIGDELISIDGVNPFDFLPTIVKYDSDGFDLTDRHKIYKALTRPAYIAELTPKTNRALLQFEKADGTRYSEEIAWTIRKEHPEMPAFVKDVVPRPQRYYAKAAELNWVAQGSLLEMGNPKPFFATEQVKQKFHFAEVTANEDFRKKYGLAPNEKPPIFAALYKYEGKTILLVRQAGYGADDFKDEIYMKAYMAILDQYEEVADVLVVDQNHNPGGSYCETFFSLFINEEKHAPVQMCRADRLWIRNMKEDFFSDMSEEDKKKYAEEIRAYKSMANDIEKAYDAGEFLSPPIPLFSGSVMVKPPEYNWTKPMLVLADELAGSCGDIFPMLVRDNKVAKIFGQRTMGLGGNVEPVLKLTNLRSELSLTRGLYTTYKPSNDYTDSDMMENNGVAPDYPYSHTVNDFRARFTGYVEEFSKRAVEQIEKR